MFAMKCQERLNCFWIALYCGLGSFPLQLQAGTGYRQIHLCLSNRERDLDLDGNGGKPEVGWTRRSLCVLIHNLDSSRLTYTLWSPLIFLVSQNLLVGFFCKPRFPKLTAQQCKWSTTGRMGSRSGCFRYEAFPASQGLW